MFSHRTLHYLLIFAIWPLCSVAAADTTGALPGSVARILAGYKVPSAEFSAYVHEIGQPEPLLAFNEAVPRNPASTIKLVTTFVGLESLGPAYTWKTEAFLDGDITDGTLDGDLLIKGYGDPYFVIERFWLFLRELRNRGLSSVDGNLLIDDSYFELTADRPGSFDGQPLRVYNVIPSALLVNFQSVRFSFAPDAVTGRVQIVADPMPTNLEISNRLKLARGGCRGYQNGVAISVGDADSRNPVIFSGSLAENCREYSMSRSVLQPATYTYGVFKTLWEANGGRITGGVGLQTAPADGEPFVSFASPPLADVIRSVNKFSNNIMARQLLLTIGAELIGPPGTVEKGREAIGLVLASRGLALIDLHMENGAGLSRETRISARDLGRVLLDASDSPYQSEFISSFALGGLDGTLRRRFTQDDLRGRVHLKTGRLDDVFAMAGYVYSRSGRQFIVVGIQNSKGAHQGPGEEAETALVRWVYEH
jgi:D-alanyl-D-alanine carboxypeptidase/D-alanyl-D-alanine-endopeptidase (penicillin-binding protein 4)